MPVQIHGHNENSTSNTINQHITTTTTTISSVDMNSNNSISPSAHTCHGKPSASPPDHNESPHDDITNPDPDTSKTPTSEPPLTTPNYESNDNDDPDNNSNTNSNNTSKSDSATLNPKTSDALLNTTHRPQWNELGSAEMTTTFQDPSQELFSRAVAALLDSRKITVTHSVFDHLIFIAEDYLCNLIQELKKAARIQRRTVPSIGDILILLRLSGLHVGLLDEEYQKEQEMPTILPPAWTDIELSMLPTVEHDSTELFLSSRGSDVASLIPSHKQRGSHIPKWMPPFPPDHTFMTTPSLPERVTDPRALREMIVQEGQLAEHALRRLTGVIQVDENAAHDDDDGEEIGPPLESTHLLQDTDTTMEDKTGSSTDTPIAFSIKTESLSTTPATVGVTSDSMNGSIQSKPTGIALRFALGAGNGSISSGNSTVNGIDEVKQQPQLVSKVDPITGKPISVGKQIERTKLDPFDLKAVTLSTSKKFNVVDYVHKRSKLVEKWRAKEKLRTERAMVQFKRRLWQSNLNSTAAANPKSMMMISTNSNNDESSLFEEDKDVDGKGAAISLVEHEYTAALAKIQKSKDDEAKKESIVDTGIVNWERDRYTWGS